jgi:hypothetical protein
MLTQRDRPGLWRLAVIAIAVAVAIDISLVASYGLTVSNVILLTVTGAAMVAAFATFRQLRRS